MSDFVWFLIGIVIYLALLQLVAWAIDFSNLFPKPPKSPKQRYTIMKYTTEKEIEQKKADIVAYNFK